MKNRWLMIAVLGIWAALPPRVVTADEPPTSGTDAKDHHKDKDKWEKNLGLTDDQSAKLKSLKDAQKAALKPLWDKQKELKKKLEGQVKAKAGDSDIQATLDEMTANHKAMMDQMEQFRSQKDAILTPTQRAKMMIGKMKHRHHDKKEHHEEEDEK